MNQARSLLASAPVINLVASVDYFFDASPRFLPFTFGGGKIPFEVRRHS